MGNVEKTIKKSLASIVKSELDYSSSIEEKSPQGLAVESLIQVKDRKENSLETDIELKTDLDDAQVKLHSAIELMASVLKLSPEQLDQKNIILELVNKIERKFLSKDRMSRNEIVNIARSPDMMFPQMGGGMPQQQGGGLRGLFRSRR